MLQLVEEEAMQQDGTFKIMYNTLHILDS